MCAFIIRRARSPSLAAMGAAGDQFVSRNIASSKMLSDMTDQQRAEAVKNRIGNASANVPETSVGPSR